MGCDASDPLFNVLQSLGEAPSAAASNIDLARLDSIYGDNGSAASSTKTGAVNSYA
jgi:hypothetical protein